MYGMIRDKFQRIVGDKGLRGEEVVCEILARGFAGETPPPPLGVRGAIEQNFRLPSEEYALVKGEEVLVRCEVGGFYGDAFTDRPRTFRGKLEEVFELISGDSDYRTIFFATLNATLNRLGIIERTIHCEEGDPEKCGEELARFISDHFGDVGVAHIGYQPGHVKACSKRFKNYATDLNPKNIGDEKFGVEILDGSLNEEVIEKADVACITGSTLTNGALPDLIDWCEFYDTEPIVYGVTARGAARLINLRGFCPFSRAEP